MFFWAGIDEAGYGPLLGPLVVAGTCFTTKKKPSEGFLWDLLADSLTGSMKNRDGRLVVADSKRLYSAGKGLKNIEESVLSFTACLGLSPDNAGDFFSGLCADKVPVNLSPWFQETPALKLPAAANNAAIESKSAILRGCLEDGEVSFIKTGLCLVLPEEFNRQVKLTGNKSMLLWQKSGLLLQQFWHACEGMNGFVLVDRHGGRMHYRKLLRDAFPNCKCDVREENDKSSVYRLAAGNREMWVAFKQKADSLSLPVSLASMHAKYLRELYMLAFNSFWCGEIKGLRPTAGYAVDAKRFLRDIRPLIDKKRLDVSDLVRQK